MSRSRKASRGTSPRRSGTAAWGSVQLLAGDCLEVLATLEPESVDAILTDPPYGIGFQDERWDSVTIRLSTNHKDTTCCPKSVATVFKSGP